MKKRTRKEKKKRNGIRGGHSWNEGYQTRALLPPLIEILQKSKKRSNVRKNKIMKEKRKEKKREKEKRERKKRKKKKRKMKRQQKGQPSR